MRTMKPFKYLFLTLLLVIAASTVAQAKEFKNPTTTEITYIDATFRDENNNQWIFFPGGHIGITCINGDLILYPYTYSYSPSSRIIDIYQMSNGMTSNQATYRLRPSDNVFSTLEDMQGNVKFTREF